MSNCQKICVHPIIWAPETSLGFRTFCTLHIVACSSHHMSLWVTVATELKYKYMFWGVHYRDLNAKTGLLSPQATLYQQLEFQQAVEEGEVQETGDALEVWEVYAKRPGLCDDLRNVPASTVFKGSLMSKVVFPSRHSGDREWAWEWLTFYIHMNILCALAHAHENFNDSFVK